MRENWFSRINLIILIVIGVFVSAISFVYYFVLKNPYDFLLWMIYIVDCLLFIVNAYRIIDGFDLTRIVKIILTIVTMIFFLVFCQVVVFLFVDGTSIPYSKDLFVFVPVINFANSGNGIYCGNCIMSLSHRFII